MNDKTDKPTVFVFVDTNYVDRSNSFTYLFGNRKGLMELAKMTTLVVPEVVIDELISHKEKAYQSEKAALLKILFSTTSEQAGKTLKSWNLSKSKTN